MASETQREAMAVLERSEQIYSSGDLNAAYDRLADEITEAVGELDPVILCVMLGGAMPAVEITKRLRFPFEFDYLHATRYRGETAGGELVWKVSPGIPLVDRHVVVIDDILDEGHTLQAILDALNAQGTASVRTAILLEKQHDRREPGLEADFLGLEVDDRYVFGAGMDFRGYFRQLPAVYAVPNED